MFSGTSVFRSFSVSSIAIFVLVAALSVQPTSAVVHAGTCTRYVARSGNNLNNGLTPGTAWRTVQKAATSAQPGNTVCVRGGIYNERITVKVSGTAGAYITFQNYPGELPILDGTGILVPAIDNGMVYIKNKAYIIVKGFEIRNYKTSTKDIVPIGVRITGTSHHIQIRNNRIHNIEHNGVTSEGTDAHGIAVHGTSGTTAITNIIIDGNQLYNLKLGSSESLAINGNVNGWQVTNNRIHHNNNIGIDAIGFEGTAPANDQARNGIIRGNDVYNIDSYGNPAYGNERSAGGIYIDGGTRIVVERNRVHASDIGIEIGSEHAGRATSHVTVRNNLIYNNLEVGISMGGYDTHRGSTQNCAVVNNTLYRNNTLNDWGSELYIQYDTRYNTIKNNIIVANAYKMYIQSWSAVMTGNVMDYNLFFGPGDLDGFWQWRNVTRTTFAGYRAASGNDAHGLNGLAPLFVSTAPLNLHLQTVSPAINRGQTLAVSGTADFDNQARVQGASIDIGADEVR